MRTMLSFVRMVVTATFCLAAGTVAAQTPQADTGSSLDVQISNCLTVPAGVSAKVSVAFMLKSDGTVDGLPRVVSGAEDEGGKVYAAAAVRAILRCSPYRNGPTGEVIAHFSSEDMQGTP